MYRIKEDNIYDELKDFQDKDIKFCISGSFYEEITFKKTEILFMENGNIKFFEDNGNNIEIDLGYIEEIYRIEKNKLKFLTETVEILIISL